MSVDLGPKLGLLVNAATNETYIDQFRPFLRFFDAMVLGNVINSTTTAAPASPNNGDAYLLTAAGSGAWAGQSNVVAVYSTEITQVGTDTKIPGWEFWTPNPGWMIWDTTLNTMWVFTQGAWVNWISIIGAEPPALITVASSATPNFNLSEGDVQKTVIDQAATITFSNGTAGQQFMIILAMDTTGGWEVTWGAGIVGSPPGTTPSTSTVFQFVYDGTNYLLANTPIGDQA